MACGDDVGSADGSGAAVEEASSSLWWLGVLMSILASIASNLGVNVQKFSMMREARRGPARQRPYVAQPLWFAGLLLVIGGSIGDFAALGFAAQSLITPVGGFTMVANVIFAHFWLGEHLSRLDLGGTAAVVLGVVLIAAFASKKESCYDLDELIGLYGHTSFLVYAVAVCSAAIALYVASKYFERVHARHGASSREYKRVRRAHQFIYPTLSGVLGAQSVLFAKSTAELLKSAFRAGDGDEPSPFASPMTYVIIVCMFSTIFMQLHWLAVALQWFDAVYCIPVFQCFFIMVTIFGGALYFQELSSFGLVQSVMFSVGVLVTLAGIVLLSQRQAKRSLRGRLRAAVHAVRFVVRVQRVVHASKNPCRLPAKPATALHAARPNAGPGTVDGDGVGRHRNAAPECPRRSPRLRDAKASYGNGASESAARSFDRIPGSSNDLLRQQGSWGGSGRGLTAMVHNSDAQAQGGVSTATAPAEGYGATGRGASAAALPTPPGTSVDAGAGRMGWRQGGSLAVSPLSTSPNPTAAAPASASRDTLSPLPATPTPGAATGTGAGAGSMLNRANSTHAPLPSGVALAEGLVSVASFMLPASVHNLLKLATSTRGVTSRTRVRAVPGNAVHAATTRSTPRRVSAPSLFAQPREALSSAMVHSSDRELHGLELGRPHASPHPHPHPLRHHNGLRLHAPSTRNHSVSGVFPLNGATISVPDNARGEQGPHSPTRDAGSSGAGLRITGSDAVPPVDATARGSPVTVVSGGSGAIARLGSWTSHRRHMGTDSAITQSGEHGGTVGGASAGLGRSAIGAAAQHGPTAGAMHTSVAVSTAGAPVTAESGHVLPRHGGANTAANSAPSDSDANAPGTRALGLPGVVA